MNRSFIIIGTIACTAATVISVIILIISTILLIWGLDYDLYIKIVKSLIITGFISHVANLAIFNFGQGW